MRVAIVLFPGSNCDHDIEHVYSRLLGAESYIVWHQKGDLSEGNESQDPDLVVIPGGFSFGDYLRCGAIAKVSPVMAAVRRFAEGGGRVLGICNGFQILCEAGLLPGVLLQNRSRRFISRSLCVRVQSNICKLVEHVPVGSCLEMPVAHFDGNYFTDPATLAALVENRQVVLRYCSPEGEVDEASPLTNPNGSLHAIAGICNRAGNVFGLMPHPERAAEALLVKSVPGLGLAALGGKLLPPT